MEETLLNIFRRVVFGAVFWSLESFLKASNLQNVYRNQLLRRAKSIKGLKVISKTETSSVEEKSSSTSSSSLKYQHANGDASSLSDSDQVVIRINDDKFWLRLAIDGENVCQ